MADNEELLRDIRDHLDDPEYWTPHMKLDEKAVEAALCVLLGYRPRLFNEISVDDLCAGLGRMRVSEVNDGLVRAITTYLSHAPQGGVMAKPLRSSLPRSNGSSATPIKDTDNG
jgi:hypothetical protein